MSKTYKELTKALKIIRTETVFQPKVALVLGSGLGDFAEEIDVKASVDYGDIEGFPISTVPGHRGRYVFGYIRNVPAVIMQGRVHYYEGYSAADVVMPIRLMGMMGAKVLFLTNACGAINTAYAPGDFMMIRDHILIGAPSPLIGLNIDELGPRFPDMSEVYDLALRLKIRESADNLGITLREGVYIQASGPNYETPAEIRAYGILGADVVGMSTAVEAIAASHMGMKVCGVSCVSNMAAGISKNKLSHQEVQETAKRMAPDFKKLIMSSIAGIGSM